MTVRTDKRKVVYVRFVSLNKCGAPTWTLCKDMGLTCPRTKTSRHEQGRSTPVCRMAACPVMMLGPRNMSHSSDDGWTKVWHP